jgi:hypothetical protein
MEAFLLVGKHETTLFLLGERQQWPPVRWRPAQIDIVAVKKNGVIIQMDTSLLKDLGKRR